MRLALIALKNVNNVNSFDETLELRLVQGNPADLYFRIVDLDQPVKGNSDHGYLRYVPATGATMSALVRQMDSNNEVTKVATQPFSADDRSIWKFQILATDSIQFNNLDVTLVVGGVTYHLPVISTVVSDPSGQDRFYC